MKMKWLTLAALPLTAMLLQAQDAQSWTGLLVASGCQTGSESGSAAGTTKTPREQNSTYEQAQNRAGAPGASTPSKDSDKMARVTDRGAAVDAHTDPLDRTTTPPVDDKGTRGKATMNNTPAKDAANRTGASGARSPDPDKLDASCRVGQHTTAFALLLNDGKLMRFDEAGNSKIAQQLQNPDRLEHKTKIFRTKVKGVLQNGIISIDSIEI